MTVSQKAHVMELNEEAAYQRLLAGEPQSCGMRSGRVYLPAGQECGQHSTKGNEEQLVFLKGAGELLIGDQNVEKLPVGAGKVAYIPPNTMHNVRNTENEPLVYIFCVAPANQSE